MRTSSLCGRRNPSGTTTNTLTTSPPTPTPLTQAS